MAPDRKPPGSDARFSYSAFGLSVRSWLELPELAAGDAGEGDADVTIRRGSHGFPADASGGRVPTVKALDDGLLYALGEVGSFFVRGGREIEVEPASDVEPRVVRLSLLGPAMSLLLHQRGHLLVHASSAVVHGRAVLFVGGHTRGKSTMAAAMTSRGHIMLSDDLTCVDVSESPPLVVPGIRQVKLCPDAAQALVPEGEELHELHPDSTKVGFRPDTAATVAAAAPISHVYFLEEADELEVRPIDSGQALAQLISHWYGGRFGRAMLDIIDEGELFRRCVQIASAASFRVLVRPTSLELLPRVIEVVEEDMAGRQRSAV